MHVQAADVNHGGDYLVHAAAAGGRIRALAAVTTETSEEARRRHDLYPTAAAALGRTLTAAALMAASLKGDERLQLQIIGDGPLGQVVAGADGQGQLRGYVQHPHVHLKPKRRGKLDVGGAVGQGHLYVIRDMGLREPYRGATPLVSGEIGEDVAHYFAHSEQTPAVVSLGVLVETDNSVRAAGGCLLQVFPGVEEETVAELEEGVRLLPAVSRSVDDGYRPEDLVREALDGWDLRWLERRPVRFVCPCSRERCERVLVALGDAELADMIETQGGAELTCHFCSEVYRFSAEALQALREEMARKQH